ncbi:ASCH domain-containing protein [Bifidobacterium aesculapii]|uniref:ASCH domain-containing protein n=1 Tax=Bifidobacterium aesculapii TaxID=1329411 RepID=UPI000A56505B|nr:ASCH domain-containing protein [Bifidobacterium aesculapii]
MADNMQATVADLRNWFSAERMHRYEESALDPVALYVWNTRMSKAYLEDIAHAEVMLRNFIAERLASDCDREDWFDQADYFGFDYEFRKAVERVKRRVRHAGHSITPDRVVAGLSLDSWRFLLVRKLEPTVWKALRDRANGGMPYYKSRRRREFEAHVVQLLDMRNRCSHQEPLIQSDADAERQYLDAQWQNLLWVVRAIDPQAADWIHSRSRVPALRGLRPIRSTSDLANLPKSEFMMPEPERDRLVRLILDGTKTATAALLIDYTESADPLPRIGDRSVLMDSDGRGVAVLTTTDAAVVRLADVSDQHAIDEGEGDTTAAQWRSKHETFWNSSDYRNEFSDSTFPLNDDTLVVLERFMVTERW